MSSTKFLAIVPQKFEAGDKVRVRGKVTPNAQQFSINFVNDNPLQTHPPQNIAYHFNWRIPIETIVENYKQDGIWMDQKESQYNAFDGRFPFKLQSADDIDNTKSFTDNNIIAKEFNSSYSILGPTFALEFAFQTECIYVYLIYGDGRTMITSYDLEFDLSDIETIQVWGDVDKINELAFLYQ